MKDKLTGSTALLTAAFLYGSQSPATKIASLSFPTFLQGFFRASIAGIILTLFSYKTWKKITPSDYKWFVLRSIGNIIATCGIILSVTKLSIGVASITLYAGLIISGTIFGTIIYKEKLSPSKLISLILAIIGALLIFKDQFFGGVNLYILIALLAGVGGSVWSIFSKFISHNYPLPELVAIDNILAAVWMILSAFLMKENINLSNFTFSISPLIYLGLTQVFTGQLVAKGFKTVDAGIGSVILMNDLVFGIMFGYIFFREVLSLNVIFGGILIFISTSLPNIRSLYPKIKLAPALNR